MITSQKQYDDYKKDIDYMRHQWEAGGIDAKLRINRIQRMLLAWENRPKEENLKHRPKTYKTITSQEQHDDYKQIRDKLMSMKVITPAIQVEINKLGLLLFEWIVKPNNKIRKL